MRGATVALRPVSAWGNEYLNGWKFAAVEIKLGVQAPDRARVFGVAIDPWIMGYRAGWAEAGRPR
jgi:hypothetical protein